MMKPRILVVAGDAPLRATLARWLLAAGYAVELAESPRRARQVIAEEDTLWPLWRRMGWTRPTSR
jgi:DNA-binding NtrC family response regulator